MASHAWKVFNLAQGCLQVLVLWLSWLGRVARRSPTPVLTLAVGLVVLFFALAVIAAFYVVDLLQNSHDGSGDLWLGLGCSVSTLLGDTAMIFAVMWCGVQVFKPERIEDPIRHLALVVALVGWIASVLATAMAAIRQTDISLCLAAFAGSLMLAGCSWSTDGTKGKTLRPLACIVLVVTTFTFITFTVMLSTGHLTAGSGIAIGAWALSQIEIWVWALTVDWEIFKNSASIHFCHRARRKHKKNAGMIPLCSIDPSQPGLAATHPTTAFTPSPLPPDHEDNDTYENRSSLLIPATPLENQSLWQSRQQDPTPSSSRLDSFPRPRSVAPVDASASHTVPGE